MITEDRHTLASVGMVFVGGFAIMALLIVAALFIA